MQARAFVIATTLAVGLLAFGGVATPIGELAFAEDAAASCTNVDLGEIQAGCIEAAACRALTEATGRPWNCIE